jgi:hypothetical protein
MEVCYVARYKWVCSELPCLSGKVFDDQIAQAIRRYNEFQKANRHFN